MIFAPLVWPIIDLLIPAVCVGCSRAIDGNALFCEDCEADQAMAESMPACPRCSLQLPGEGKRCPHCRGRGLPPYKKILSISLLRGPIKPALHRAKYAHRWALLERLTDRLCQSRDVAGLLDQADVLLPVPLHPRRFRERGFNQAEVIARRLRREQPRLAISRAVVRTRATEIQALIHSRPQRARNMRDAFALVDRDAIAGRHVVVVDDVMTTGATLVAVARALRPAKPARLSAVVLAAADPRGKSFEVV